jgi:hypothetical protein
MCAPGDRRKSSSSQREQAALNALLRERRADVSGGVISFGEPRICAGQLPKVKRIQ